MHARTVSAHVELSSARPAVGWLEFFSFWASRGDDDDDDDAERAIFALGHCSSAFAPHPPSRTHDITSLSLSLFSAQPISPSLRRSLLSPACRGTDATRQISKCADAEHPLLRSRVGRSHRQIAIQPGHTWHQRQRQSRLQSCLLIPLLCRTMPTESHCSWDGLMVQRGSRAHPEIAGLLPRSGL